MSISKLAYILNPNTLLVSRKQILAIFLDIKKKLLAFALKYRNYQEEILRRMIRSENKPVKNFLFCFCFIFSGLNAFFSQYEKPKIFPCVSLFISLPLLLISLNITNFSFTTYAMLIAAFSGQFNAMILRYT